jgi:RNA polymerase sigma-70 factor, ECF subfamily
MTLTGLLFRETDSSAQDRAAAAEDLEGLLDRKLSEAHRLWPEVVLSDELFLGHWGRLLPRRQPVREGVDLCHVGDLYLACASCQGDGRAMALFEKHSFGAVAAVAARVGLDANQREELEQELRVWLFFGREGSPPGLSTYSGSGSVRSWLWITALREALAMVARAGRVVRSTRGEVSRDLPGQLDDLELRYMQSRYRDEFKAAFKESLASLSAEERNLLRLHYLEGRSIDQLGALHQVHRATAARRLAKIREHLLRRTRRSLKNLWGVDQQELDQMFGLIRSKIDLALSLSLGRLEHNP